MHVIGVTPPLLGGGFTKRCQPSSPLREEFGAGHSLPASYAGTDKKPLFTPPPVDEAPAPRGGDFAWQCVGGSYLKKEPARSNPAQEQGLHSTHYPTCTCTCVPAPSTCSWSSQPLAGWHGRRTLMACSVCVSVRLPSVRRSAAGGRTSHERPALETGEHGTKYKIGV